MKHACRVALALALLASAAAADDFALTNGRKITGGIDRSDPGNPNKVVIEVGAGLITLDAKEVLSRSPGRTPLHEYYERYERVKDSRNAGDLFALAQWAKQNRLFKFVRPLCERVVGIDSEHAGARKELGQEKYQGRWMTHDEVQMSKGLVQFEGRWVTKAEKELVEKKRLEEKERKMAEAAERERKKEEARRAKLEALQDYQDWLARASRLPYGYLYQPSWFWPAYYRPYPWLPYQHKRPPSYGYYGGYYDALPTFSVFDFVGNPFRKR